MQGSKQLRFTHLNLTLLEPYIHLHVAHAMAMGLGLVNNKCNNKEKIPHWFPTS